MLLTSRNGDQLELTTMPNNHTAPWLRGMYNTTPVAWQDRPSADTWDNLAPLAIGWWPRYPSGYPQTLESQHAAVENLVKKPTTTLTREEKNTLAEFSALMRCRSYAWAGFPLRFFGSRFPQEADLANMQVLSTGYEKYDIHAFALDASFDWSQAGRVSANPFGVNTLVDVTKAFLSERFARANDDQIPNSGLFYPANTPRAVDGAELRVAWSYRNNRLTDRPNVPAEWLTEAAQNGNVAPMIGPVRLRTYAPNQVLNVER
jgi:hypothetical protein